MHLQELEPKAVFSYFAEISKIPRGSGHTDEIAAYCLAFARRRGLAARRDGYGNVMIWKPGTAGYTDSAPVILQGHLDMVCEKAPGCTRDMERDGIVPLVDGDFLYADGTTLGGDDGIAVAYILAALDADNLSHPPLEALLTTDEEVGLRGARALDAAGLNGRRLISLDAEQEGVFTVGCAGSVNLLCSLPLTQTAPTDALRAVRVRVDGLLGGHSGQKIQCRKNAALVLTAFLRSLCEFAELRVAELRAGNRLNVIPSAAEAVICCPAEQTAQIYAAAREYAPQLTADCAGEPDVSLALEEAPLPALCADPASTHRLLFTLEHSVNGVCAMDPSVAGGVQTSSNVGRVRIEDGRLELGLMLRSNTALGKQNALQKQAALLRVVGGSLRTQDDQPVWEYRPHSPLRDVMENEYRAMYGAPPRLEITHAGLECGVLAEKLAGADAVAIGPDMYGIHSPAERLSISSAARCWEFLTRVLAALR